MNNTEREMWVDNDEGLYRWWQSSRQSKRQFIRDNRSEIDRCINQALGKEPRYAEFQGRVVLARPVF